MINSIELLVQKGHRCIVCVSSKGLMSEEVTKAGGELIYIRLGVLRRKYFNLPGFINRLFFISLSVLKLIRIVRKEKVDLIYSNTTGVLSGAIVSFLTRTKHLWHIHEIIQESKLFAKFLAWAIKNLSDVTIVVSNEVKKHWNSLYPFKKNKIKVVYNGINLSKFNNTCPKLRKELQINDETLLIGTIGRIHYWKGQDYFIKLANRIYKKYKNTKFVLVGDAFPGYEYLYYELQSLIQQFEMENVIIYLGYRNDIPDILSSLDIFILPSILPDPFPTVVLEAMAAKKPVIATAHGGALEMIVDQETGILIPWDNINESFEKIIPVLEDTYKRREMGEKGFIRLKKFFSLEKYKSNLICEINNLF